MSLKELLTKERIAKAFEVARHEVKLPCGTLLLITEDHYSAAKRFFDDSLVQDEPCCIALGAGFGPTMQKIYEAHVTQNMSLMVVDERTNQIIAVRIMGVATNKDDHHSDENDDDALKKLLAFWEYCDIKAEFFKHYNTNECISFFGLGVDKNYRHRGVASALMEAALCMIKNFDVSPVYAKAAASSTFSDKIFQKNGFDLLYEIRYDDYTVDGEQVIKMIDGHTHLRSYGKKL